MSFILSQITQIWIFIYLLIFGKNKNIIFCLSDLVLGLIGVWNRPSWNCIINSQIGTALKHSSEWLGAIIYLFIFSQSLENDIYIYL